MPSQPSLLTRINALLLRFKPYLRWMILGATLFFVGSALWHHWSEVAALRLDWTGWITLGIALVVTLLAHIWSGWVWGWILQALNQPVRSFWSVSVYLQTNIAKYLPGNVWHFYGRVMAAKTAGVSLTAATVSVLLEPLLMAAAALIIALTNAGHNALLQGFILMTVLLALHPRFLNPLLQLAARLKGKSQLAVANSPLSTVSPPPTVLLRYPLRPLLGEIGFVALRGTGFALTLFSLTPLPFYQLPAVFSAFSVAWMLGLVIPGAPGGIGVFEATAIALLRSSFAPGIILGSVALYRVVSTLAEVLGAGLAWIGESAKTRQNQ
ncbi:MAG: flippase-like domain-containing protein [Synechococcales cyanobacterium M58_A2018_015]|nr:flippase-like domain-containing protein [Synechococcales cyanobacterium M58_A2018_015]